MIQIIVPSIQPSNLLINDLKTNSYCKIHQRSIAMETTIRILNRYMFLQIVFTCFSPVVHALSAGSLQSLRSSRPTLTLQNLPYSTNNININLSETKALYSTVSPLRTVMCNCIQPTLVQSQNTCSPQESKSECPANFLKVAGAFPMKPLSIGRMLFLTLLALLLSEILSANGVFGDGSKQNGGRYDISKTIQKSVRSIQQKINYRELTGRIINRESGLVGWFDNARNGPTGILNPKYVKRTLAKTWEDRSDTIYKPLITNYNSLSDKNKFTMGSFVGLISFQHFLNTSYDLLKVIGIAYIILELASTLVEKGKFGSEIIAGNSTKMQAISLMQKVAFDLDIIRTKIRKKLGNGNKILNGIVDFADKEGSATSGLVIGSIASLLV